MISAPIPPDEGQRLAALREYRILDTAPEQAYDDITTMASYICGTPIALMSLVDETRQWFKSKTGIDQPETRRDISFCAHGILSNDLMVVPDATKDRRFWDNPLVTQDPHVRFYAGAPLINPEGQALGMLCVMDHRPRRLNRKQRQALKALSSLVLAHMEFRRISNRLARTLEEVKTLKGLLPICMYCKQIRDDRGYWNKLELYISEKTDANFSHGICPKCMQQHFPESVGKISL